MNKKLQFFLVFMAIILPLNLLISYVTDGGKLTIKAFAGDLTVTLIIYFVTSQVNAFSAKSYKK